MKKSNVFRTALLDEMERRLGASFKKVKFQCYTNHKDRFYLYVKPNKCNPETVAKYIGRYLGRPVIATSRIDNYDEYAGTVTFHYNRHEDDKYIQETIPAMDFIKRLIRHIPEKHFKMIRYGGLYARHRKIDKNLYLAVSKEKRHVFRSFNRWRTAILSSFEYDPLNCPDYKHEMLFLELYYNVHCRNTSWKRSTYDTVFFSLAARPAYKIMCHSFSPNPVYNRTLTFVN